MIIPDINIDEVGQKILEIARIVDINCGRGPAGSAMFYNMVADTFLELREVTHAHEEDIATLRNSWLPDDKPKQLPMRGFYDPYGLSMEIKIDPHAEKPERAANYHPPEESAFAWEENLPIFYHRYEFGRGGDHDAPALVWENIDAHFEDALQVFFSEIGGQLNGIDINTTSLGGMAAIRAAAASAAAASDKASIPIFL